MQIIESLKQDLRKHKPLRILSKRQYPDGDGFRLVFPDVRIDIRLIGDKIIATCTGEEKDDTRSALVEIELSDPHSLETLDKAIQACKTLVQVRQELQNRLNAPSIWNGLGLSYRLIFSSVMGPGMLERATIFADVSVVGAMVNVGAQRREKKNGLRRANAEFDFLDPNYAVAVEEFIRQQCLTPIERGPRGRLCCSQ
jgi:hypothetical protein